MKFIVDESTGRSVADFLEENYDTIYVGDWNEGAKDKEIMDKATKENRITVTNDKDFGKLAVKDGRRSIGITILRLKIETPENKVNTVSNLLEKHKDKLPGNLVIAKEDSIKVREL